MTEPNSGDDPVALARRYEAEFWEVRVFIVCLSYHNTKS